MLNRDDVERIVHNIINGLSLELDYKSRLGQENTRTVILKLNGNEIDSVTFSIEKNDLYSNTSHRTME